MVKSLWLAVMALALLLTAPMAARAQNSSAPPIRAEANRLALSTDEVLTVSVAINAAGSGATAQPVMPVLDGFTLVGSSMTTSMSIINGIVSGEIIYLYQLQPTRTGTLTIPPFSAEIDGQTYTTQPIQVQVSQGSTAVQLPPAAAAPNVQAAPNIQAAPRAAGDPTFVEAVADKETPYVGEQVLYKFRLYQSVMLASQPSYQGPSFTGFWNNQQTVQTEYMETLNGARYRVTELTNILFPTAGGTLTIEPARLTLPATFTQPVLVLETEPVTLSVRPLPPNPPPDFEGAVGQYSISVRTDTTTVDARSDSVTLQVTISGAGNIDTLPNPPFSETGDWRVYDTRGNSNAEFANGVYRGARTIEYVIAPTREGMNTIPPISFSYFDPTAEQYQTISTNPIEIAVAPGAAQAPAITATAPAVTTPEPTPEPAVAEATAEPSALRPLKPADDSPTTLSASLVREPAFWALWATPVVAFLGNVALRRRERHLLENEARIRSSRALARARKALTQARRHHDDSHGAAARALMRYLSDKTGQPVAGMTHAMLTRLLSAEGIPDELIRRVDSCLTASEAGRYGPQREAPNARAMLNETERVIKELEREFSA